MLVFIVNLFWFFILVFIFLRYCDGGIYEECLSCGCVWNVLNLFLGFLIIGLEKVKCVMMVFGVVWNLERGE